MGTKKHGVGDQGLPRAPETRARGSPEGEVPSPRDFPKGNAEGRARAYPWSSRTLPTLPLTASFLISLPPAATPPTPSSFLYGICGSSLTFRENPTFLQSRAFRIYSPTFPPPRVRPGLQMHQVRTASPAPIHLASVPVHVRLSHRNSLHAEATVSLLLSLPNPVQMSSPRKPSTSPESESLLPLRSLPPPGNAAQGAFGDIRSSIQAGTRCGSVTAALCATYPSVCLPVHTCHIRVGLGNDPGFVFMAYLHPQSISSQWLGNELELLTAVPRMGPAT